MAGSAIVGFPFYIVKKIFWDLPRWWLGIDRSPATSEVQPALEETPFQEPRLPERMPDAPGP
jgi:hypothetical protein